MPDDVPHRRDDLAPALVQLAHRQALDRAHGDARVGHARDLRLVEHQAAQREPRRRGDARGEGRDVARVVQRRPPRAQVDGDEAEPDAQRRVHVEARAHGRGVARTGLRERLAHELEVGGVVDHEGDLAPAGLVAGERGEGAAVDGRVAHEDVAEPLVDEPQGLAHRVGHDPLEAALDRARDERAHAHRLRRDAHGHSPGAGEQLVRVGVEPVEVDDRERPVEGSRRTGQTGEQGRGRAPLLGRSSGLVHVRPRSRVGRHGENVRHARSVRQYDL